MPVFNPPSVSVGSTNNYVGANHLTDSPVTGSYSIDSGNLLWLYNGSSWFQQKQGLALWTETSRTNDVVLKLATAGKGLSFGVGATSGVSGICLGLFSSQATGAYSGTFAGYDLGAFASYSVSLGGYSCNAFGDGSVTIGGQGAQTHGVNSLASGFFTDSQHDNSFTTGVNSVSVSDGSLVTSGGSLSQAGLHHVTVENTSAVNTLDIPIFTLPAPTDVLAMLSGTCLLKGSLGYYYVKWEAVIACQASFTYSIASQTIVPHIAFESGLTLEVVCDVTSGDIPVFRVSKETAFTFKFSASVLSNFLSYESAI